MDFINDYSDDRHRAWCLHCGSTLSKEIATRDHVPSKTFLLEPYPNELPTILICENCNNGFSADEQYFRIFIECVLMGSTDPKIHVNPQIARALERDPALKARIEAAKIHNTSESARSTYYWKPDIDALRNVTVKNARGHALYELGEPMLEEPTSIWTKPLANLAPEARSEFETTDLAPFWPEVGSRMLTRLVTGQDTFDGWVHVQDG